MMNLRLAKYGKLGRIFGAYLALAGTALAMLVAIFSVHIQNGLFMSNNGYEFGLALLAASVSLLLSGAGKASVDNLIASKLNQ